MAAGSSYYRIEPYQSIDRVFRDTRLLKGIFKMLKKTLLFLLSTFLLLTLTAYAQDTAPTLFTLYSDQPVMPHGDKTTDWDYTYTDPGAVIYHDGKFHMFRNGFNGWPASVQIGYATSEDGLKWTEVSPDPVMMTKDVPYAKVAALASDVVVQDDGTWVMYFYTWNTMSEHRAPMVQSDALPPKTRLARGHRMLRLSSPRQRRQLG